MLYPGHLPPRTRARRPTPASAARAVFSFPHGQPGRGYYRIIAIFPLYLRFICALPCFYISRNKRQAEAKTKGNHWQPRQDPAAWTGPARGTHQNAFQKLFFHAVPITPLGYGPPIRQGAAWRIAPKNTPVKSEKIRGGIWSCF